jgi:hypothetical protein
MPENMRYCGLCHWYVSQEQACFKDTQVGVSAAALLLEDENTLAASEQETATAEETQPSKSRAELPTTEALWSTINVTTNPVSRFESSTSNDQAINRDNDPDSEISTYDVSGGPTLPIFGRRDLLSMLPHTPRYVQIGVCPKHTLTLDGLVFLNMEATVGTVAGSGAGFRTEWMRLRDPQPIGIAGEPLQLL